MRFDSDKAIARAAKVNDFVIHNLSKTGRKSFPYADNAVRIARALETTVEYLVTGVGPAVPERQDPDIQQILSLLDGLTHDQLVELRGMIRERIETHFKGVSATATGDVEGGGGERGGDFDFLEKVIKMDSEWRKPKVVQFHTG